MNVSYLCIILVLVLANQEVTCKRSSSGGSGGRQRTTSRSAPRTTQRPHSTTHAYQHENNYQVGNPPPPSSPVLHQQNSQNAPIGFDNVNRQSANPIGFENRAPQGYQPPHQQQFGGGQQAPQQPHYGYNNQQQFGGGQQVPQQPHYGYNSQGTWGHTPHTPGYNPYLSQPNSYYNNYATPGMQPQLFQPQQSSGFGAGSLLGLAGSFGGGYLLGRLTSGGHDDHKDSKTTSTNTNNDQQQFVVHHYYHNSQEVPKQMTISNSSIATCMQNLTQTLCVPNTFPMCLSNGTIMCVTHTRFTVPCGTNSAMACIVTALPCNSKDKSCNTASNLSSTVVYVPCVSNVTISGQNETSLGNDLCVTAIAEPAKKLDSPVPSLVNLMTVIATLPFQLQEVMSTSGFPNVNTTAYDVKTEMPPPITVRDG